ncbi:MAG: InlB B-repeat-containing protein [Clostridia bacterium]|nr:InlB B-repeat-containing protein [Clostridia bacterium]
MPQLLYTVNDDITLYAIYRKATALKLFAAGEQAQTAYLYNNETSTVTMPTPIEYEGWTAIGWRTDTNTDEPTVIIGDKIAASSSTKYYAVYSRIITLTYDSDGGEEIEPIQYTQYCNVTGNKTTFYSKAIKAQKYGYHFKYWEADIDDEPYYETQQITLDDSLVLKAVYDRLPVVTYDYSTNGGTSSTIESAPVADDNYNTVDLTPTAEKDGWEFAGWSRNMNAKEGDSNIWKIDGDITVYAIFKRDLKVRYIDKYKEIREDTATMYNNDTYASYDMIDRSDDHPVYYLPRDIDNETAKFINADMADIGWERVGWRMDTEPNPEVVDNNKIQQLSQDTDFYAVYKQEFATRYYINEDATSFEPYPFPKNDTKYFNSAGNEGTVKTTIDYTFNYEGCTFIGWQEKNTGVRYNNGDEVITNKRLNLVALWKTNKPKTEAIGIDVPEEFTPSGTYILGDNPVEVRLAHEAESVKYYYTTDGTVPTTNSTEYGTEPLYISDGLTLNVIAVAKYASPSDPVTFTYHKATAPHINAIDTYGKEVVIRFEQPENIDEKKITVKALDTQLALETEQTSDEDMWKVLDSTVESDGVIRASGLKPLTEYMFIVECEFQNGTLDSNKVLGKTTEYVSSACDIEDVLFPLGAKM